MSSFELTERRADYVLRVLRERLSKADVKKGARLPPERALAAELNVSRRVLRQALEVLEKEHLIQRIPGRGTIILAKGQKDSSTAQVLDIRQYTGPIELMDARCALEPAIAAMAAIHATSSDIDELWRCVERSQDTFGHAQAWEQWDSAFHSALGKAAHNRILEHFFKMLIAARGQTSWGKLRRASLSAKRQALYIKQHKNILYAIESREPTQAKQAMKKHLSTVRKTLLQRLDVNPYGDF